MVTPPPGPGVPPVAAAAVVTVLVLGSLAATSERGPGSGVNAPAHSEHVGVTPDAVAQPLVVEAKPAVPINDAPQEPPTRVRLASGESVHVRAVSSARDGLMNVPSDIREAGWWRGGSQLGDPFGSTLLASHVDSKTQGLGPFASLLGARPLQQVTLHSQHLDQTFRTESVQLVDRGSVRRLRWLSSASGARRLVLVTCAPPYVPARGGYQNLVVVTATPMSRATRRGSS